MAALLTGEPSTPTTTGPSGAGSCSGITATGDSACLARAVLTEPSSARRNAPSPRLPTTTRCASSDRRSSSGIGAEITTEDLVVSSPIGAAALRAVSAASATIGLAASMLVSLSTGPAKPGSKLTGMPIAYTRCSGRRCLAAYSAAQTRARWAVSEPSTPTTTGACVGTDIGSLSAETSFLAGIRSDRPGRAVTPTGHSEHRQAGRRTTGVRGPRVRAGMPAASRGARPRQDSRGTPRPGPVLTTGSVRAGQMPGKPLVPCRGRRVQADDPRRLAARGVLGGDRVQRGHRRGVPDVRPRQVDDHLVRVAHVVELIHEIVAGGEEQLAAHLVDAGGAAV